MNSQLTKNEFELFRKFIYENVGISLSHNKDSLIKGRLQKRLKALELHSFTEYYTYLKSNREELYEFVNAISTNVTHFFREPMQWKFLNNYVANILPNKKNKKLRIWSAGCSSGEEPYSIISFLAANLKDFEQWDIKILATDISQKALKKAIAGEYQAKDIESSDQKYIRTGFDKHKLHDGTHIYTIKPALKDKIVFRLFNLVSDPFILRVKFDIVMCRNVMIYFDDKTRATLYKKFSSVLEKGSLFFIGSSEAILDKDNFELVQYSIYRRI
jgi:chemotaxis protein methyltransferase CheR